MPPRPPVVSLTRFAADDPVDDPPDDSQRVQRVAAQVHLVGVAYMLTQTAFQLLYGKLSDLLGRKVRRYALLSLSHWHTCADRRGGS